MDFTKILFELLIAFLLAGGFGYINYFILHKIGVINVSNDNKEEKSFSLILFSIINLAMFILLKGILDNINIDSWIIVFISLIVTLGVTISASFTLFKWIVSIIYIVINNNRKKLQLGEIDNRSVRTLIFDKNKVLFAYMYSLESGELLSYGYIGWQHDKKAEDFEIEIVPTDLLKELNYGDAIEMAKKNVDASIYINVDKKIKMVVIPEQ